MIGCYDLQVMMLDNKVIAHDPISAERLKVRDIPFEFEIWGLCDPDGTEKCVWFEIC
jgi:hypothetical protein